MKKYRIQISIFGFIVQVLLLYFLASHFGYWYTIGLYYTIFSIAILLYNIIIDKTLSLQRFCTQYMVIIITAVILAGLLTIRNVVNIIWLILIGMITGATVCVIVYHIVRLILPAGLEEKGFNHTAEISLTFFAFTLYPTFLLIPVSLTSALLAFLSVLVLCIIAGLILSLPIKITSSKLSASLKEWDKIEKLPRFNVAGMVGVIEAMGSFITSMKKSFGGVKSMGMDIKTSSEDLSSVSEQMNASLQEVSSTIQQISKGAQEQSSSITTIARSIEELNNLTTSISSQVKMANVSSRRTTNSAKQGMDLSKQEAEISKNIFEQTQDVEEKMNELREQSNEIKKILDIIGGITEQTDLLALNAAIEAARVGEEGRGFAVVADEIRNLANETQRSSAVVETLISETNNTIQELSVLHASERKKMTESKELAIRAEEQFTGIVKAVDLVTDMISRISEAAVNQANNTKSLVKQVEQIAQVSADTAAATQEVSAAVQEQTASMQEFTSTAQVLAQFATKLDELLTGMKK